MRRTRFGIALVGLALLACEEPPSSSDVTGAPGDPIAGLSATQLGRFVAGQTLFNRAFTPEEGLGPLFNQAQCSSCHDLPTSGGHGAEPVRKATRWDPDQTCDLLVASGGDLLQSSVTPAGRAAGLMPDRIPQGANGIVELVPPALYGLGLVEVIPRAALTARADPDDEDGDGISGRLGRSEDGQIAVFGVKGTHATLLSFVEGATRGELGLTTPAHPVEEVAQVNGDGSADPAAEPEVDDAFLEAVTDYIRLLAPPARAWPTDPEERRAAERGARVFEEIGCSECHVPTWTTEATDLEALSERTFPAYSDFLLHDLGSELADICGPNAAPSEWRTTPLVGLHLRRIFLHSGRAQTLSDAVELHGGEAAAARNAFRERLTPEARDDLLRFLQSL